MTNATLATAQDTTLRFDYKMIGVADLKVIPQVTPSGKTVYNNIEIDGRPHAASNRFWSSLFSKYGFGKSFFNYFEPHEVFDRISSTRGDDQIRICVQTQKNGDHELNTLLATSAPSKPVLGYDELRGLLEDNDGIDIQYGDGILGAEFVPRGQTEFSIRGDVFNPKFVLQAPIDGYGDPQAILAALRLVCSNGSVMMDKMFSNGIPRGKDEDGGLMRIEQVIQGFGDDAGYEAMRSRYEASADSFASLLEVFKIQDAIVSSLEIDGQIVRPSNADENVVEARDRVHAQQQQVGDILQEFGKVVGDPLIAYGLANRDAVSKKRLQMLPCQGTTVYDLMNFATEVATHKVSSTIAKRKIHGVVGSLFSKDFDLEGSNRGGKGDHVDLYIKNAAILRN